MAFLRALRRLLQRRRVEHEIDEELAFHLEMETQANLARGMPPAEARRGALAAFGGVVQAKEMVRDVRALSVEALWQDVRQATRMLTGHRGFTLAAAGMLALAIGITTAMFTLVDSLVLRPVPFRDPGQLAHLWMGTDRGGLTLVSPAVVRAWRASPAFAAVESARSDTGLLDADSVVAAPRVATVTPGVFDLLGGVTPIRGRLFDAAEGMPGRTDRVLVSEIMWRTLFDADPALVGRRIRIDGESVTVIGILPADFRFPAANTMVWRPSDLGRGSGEDRALAYVRFAPGLPREEALRLATDAAHAADATTVNLRPRVSPLVRALDPYLARAVPLLTGGIVLVFLVLCANTCSLLLARLTARAREFSMRAALGASRGRLMRQALVESGVLGVLGVAGGAAVAWLLVSLAQAVLPPPLLLRTLNPLGVDGRALAAACCAGLMATLGAGVLPAWLGTNVDAGESLRVVDRGGTEARGARLLTRSLLVGEVALACTLLLAATLLTRSFVNLATADRGFDTSGVTTLWLNLGSAEGAGREALVLTLEDGFRQMPGVRQVAWSYGVPPGGGVTDDGPWVSDAAGASALNMTVGRYMVSPEFLPLYGIPIVQGRGFTPDDRFPSAIVSERLAQALWPEADPIGRTFRFSDGSFHVIGVAREIHYPSIDSADDGPEYYLPYRAGGNTAMVSLRCDPACPDQTVIRHRLAASHQEVRVQDAGPVERAYAAELALPRASATLAAVFAVVAVLAAAGGLFSVLSYAVGRRRREFGIRAALGASPGRIRRLVLRDALRVAAAGLAIGSLLATGVGRALASLQYGVTPGDPLSWAMVLGLLAATVLAASWGPADAAARLDPLSLLREE